jgi:APA family basic amino acid/polyamine antiporter
LNLPAAFLVLAVTALAGSEAPLSDAIRIGVGLDGAGDLRTFGATVAITSVTLTILYGQTRIFFAMSRDGLRPPILGAPVRAPHADLTTAMFGILIAIIAALLPLSEIAKLVNIGTLFAFVIVNIGVIVLRAPARISSAASASRSCRCSRSSARRCAST